MKRFSSAVIELRDLRLETNIGTYGPNDVKPDLYLLDLKLGIPVDHVVISQDGMEHVFDYDPLIKDIVRLSADGHYATQERLITRIAVACATYPEVKAIEICLKKLPIRLSSGSLGVRLVLTEIEIDELRPHKH